MTYSALLFGLLVGAGLFIGGGIAAIVERRRMKFARSASLVLVVCMVVLFVFNTQSFSALDLDSLARALFLSFIELPIVAVPSVIAMMVVRKALRKRGRSNVKVH